MLELDFGLAMNEFTALLDDVDKTNGEDRRQFSHRSLRALRPFYKLLFKEIHV